MQPHAGRTCSYPRLRAALNNWGIPLRLNFSITLVARVGLTVALALGAGGCWLAAIQLAPLGLQAAEGLGTGAAYLVEDAHGTVNHDTGFDSNDDKLEDQMDRQFRCDELEFQGPDVVELRMVNGGATEYRELRPDDSTGQLRWEPILGDGTNSDGWLAATNLLRLKFTPPIQPQMPKSGSLYIAYGSASPGGMEGTGIGAFGKPTGTFALDGQPYEYVVARKLPCFPGP